MEFLVRGATQYKEPGVFLSFEETEKEFTTNVASLGFDLTKLVEQKKIWLEHIHVDRNEIQQSGEYDLEGLFIRIHLAIESIGAKRVVLDTIESLFSGLPNALILRSELRRLLGWLKKKGVTTILTAERGINTLTREGLEEYVSDCVILLDHRVRDQISIRRLRVVKYRGSTHGTNEYPFLIDEDGFSVLPVTSLGLNHSSSLERISTGIPRLDTMLSGKGYFRASTVPVPAPQVQARRASQHDLLKQRARGRTRPLFHVRGISRSAYSQHAINRHRPGTMGKKGIAKVSCDATDALWSGNTPFDEHQIDQQL